MCLNLFIRFHSYSLYSQFYDISSTCFSSAFIAFFIGAIIFNFQELVHILPFFSEQLVLLFYGCNIFSNLSEDMNLIFQSSLLFPDSTISFGESCSVFILASFSCDLLFPKVCLSWPVLMVRQ